MSAPATRAKALVKRSRRLHGTAKLVRLAATSSPRLLFPVRRTSAIRQVLPNTMLSLPALINVYECVKTIEEEHVAGDIAECGVWAGGAIGLMYSTSRRYGDGGRRFHLFDSFEGLPQPSHLDTDVSVQFRQGHPELDFDDGKHPGALVAIGACEAPLADVTHLFDDVLQAPSGDYVIHKGWFQDTLPQARPTLGDLAILRLDGDWYESTLACLECLYDNLVPGGYLILDDYGFFAGCTQAVDEFLASRGPAQTALSRERWGAYLRKP